MNKSNLTEDQKRTLFKGAREARKNAYAPYSNFLVGAAILSETATIYTGCNVENAAYPQGSCAEAGAISAMVNAGETRISAIAVVGTGDALVTPCGGCRQRIREFASGETPILIFDEERLREETTLETLLPLSFGPHNLTQQ